MTPSLKPRRARVTRGPLRLLVCSTCDHRVVASLPNRCRGCGRVRTKLVRDLATTARQALLRRLALTRASTWTVKYLHEPGAAPEVKVHVTWVGLPP